MKLNQTAAIVSCCLALSSMANAQASSGWSVQITPHGTNQSLATWSFFGAITNAEGVRWNAGVHNMGAFGISSPLPSMGGFYSGSAYQANLTGAGGLRNITADFEYPFHSFRIQTNGVFLMLLPSMQIQSSPYTRTTIAQGSVVIDKAFDSFGEGVYVAPRGTFWDNAIEGGFDTTLTVAVPEPSTYALLLLAGAGALWRARRQMKRAKA